MATLVEEAVLVLIPETLTQLLNVKRGQPRKAGCLMLTPATSQRQELLLWVTDVNLVYIANFRSARAM